MSVPKHRDVINAIDKYLDKTGMKSHDFGKKFLNDSGALSRLRKGADPRLSTVLKIYEAIGENNATCS